MRPTGRFPSIYVGFRPTGRGVAGVLCALAALALLGALGAAIASGERSQQGNLIVSLDGGWRR